ncbi:RNA 2'-phosphotransferase [Succinimonas amylolytica]|uniref:RNA 2'-phosphotransferase n=1 Tax=Succinimonas amylolytica TaxID=83769 RepID=UPI00036A8187|nr:RNA 2'-phosphotransferase [Succinimonas amylolytica]
MNRDETGRFIALILRHRPETIGIALDEHGWADTEELVAGIARFRPFDMSMLEEIVRTDAKQRYSFNDDKTRIRANQGHSIPVDAELRKAVPPDILYHGTALKYAAAIAEQGLLPKARLYVHLSGDTDTARAVGKRHGKPVVYQIDSRRMHEDGFDFCCSVNGVWLTRTVPPGYLRRLPDEPYQP